MKLQFQLVLKFSIKFQNNLDPIKFKALNWTTDDFTVIKIKQASTYSNLIGNSILESHSQIQLPFLKNYDLNYLTMEVMISKIFVIY